MTSRLTVTTIAMAISALASTHVLADPDAAPPTRASVKADVRSAQKAGLLTPAGEASPNPVAQPRSNKTRADRKGETVVARHAGQLRKAGEEPEWKTTRELSRTPSTTTRAERKTKTLAAARAGQLTPAGEGPGR